MIVSYHWDFGDGNTAYTAEAIHIFDTPGDYEVTLTITDRSGNEGSETITVTARPALYTLQATVWHSNTRRIHSEGLFIPIPQ